MTVVVYPAILDDSENEKGLYTVTFPDVPGAIGDGHGTGEAMARGSEALGGILCETPVDKLPPARDWHELQKQNPGKLVVPIFCDLNEARIKSREVTVKKNTTIPGELAYRAEQAGINFSQVLTEALREKLNIK